MADTACLAQNKPFIDEAQVIYLWRCAAYIMGMVNEWLFYCEWIFNERSMHIEQILVHRRTFAYFKAVRIFDFPWRTGPRGCVWGYVFAARAYHRRVAKRLSPDLRRPLYEGCCQFLAAYSGRAHTAEIKRGSPRLPAVGAYHRCIDNLTLPAGGSRGGLSQLSEQQLHGSYWP